MVLSLCILFMTCFLFSFVLDCLVFCYCSCQQIFVVCIEYNFPEAEALVVSLLFSQGLEMSLSILDTLLLV